MNDLSVAAAILALAYRMEKPEKELIHPDPRDSIMDDYKHYLELLQKHQETRQA